MAVTAIRNTIVHTTLSLVFCFLCCGGIGIGFYLSGCDPTGYCKGGLSKATATGNYPTVLNTCTACSKHSSSCYSDGSGDCCEYYDYDCWDSYAEFTYSKGTCLMEVDTNNDNFAAAISDAAAKYPKGKTMKVQSVNIDDDGDMCMSALNAEFYSYFGVALMCISCILLMWFLYMCRRWHKTGAFKASFTDTRDTTTAQGPQMIIPLSNTVVMPPPQSYPYSTYLPTEPAGVPNYQPTVMYGPPGPVLMYYSLPNQCEQHLVHAQPVQDHVLQAIAV